MLAHAVLLISSSNMQTRYDRTSVGIRCLTNMDRTRSEAVRAPVGPAVPVPMSIGVGITVRSGSIDRGRVAIGNLEVGALADAAVRSRGRGSVGGGIGGGHCAQCW